MAVSTATGKSLTHASVASRGLNSGRLAGDISTYAILIAFLIIFLLPFIWIWSSAFKTSQEIGRNPFALPTELRWENLVEAWTVGHFREYMFNSAIYCAAIVAGSVAFACLAGYGLSMLPLPGRDSVLVLFLLGLTVPFQSVMIPMYYLLRDTRLLETYWAFIIPGIAIRLPFGIFLMRGFFRGLPRDLGTVLRAYASFLRAIPATRTSWSSPPTSPPR